MNVLGVSHIKSLSSMPYEGGEFLELDGYYRKVSAYYIFLGAGGLIEILKIL